MKPEHIDRDTLRSLWFSSKGADRTICPTCSPQRRPENRNIKVLSLRQEGEGLVWFCHHHHDGGAIPLFDKGPRIVPADRFLSEVEAPIPQGETGSSLSEDHVAWLMSRGVSEETALKAGVFSKPWSFQGMKGEGLWFPYLDKEGRPYAHKIRTRDKMFSQAGGCITLFNQHNVKPEEDLYLLEGEMDTLSLMEIGVSSCVSVPNGAPVKVSDHKVDPSEDRKFSYVWSAKTLIDNAKRIIIATDGDSPGQALAEELARRIGKPRCWRITWPEGCKDANDVLMKLGPDRLKEIISNPEPWPIAGVYEAKHFEQGVKALYQGGLSKGVSTGWPNVDRFYTVVPGHLTVITGAPGDGKSSWLDAMLVNLASQQNWAFAIYSTERPPDVHIAMLASLHLNKPFFSDTHGPRLTEAELDEAIEWVNDHFVFIGAEETATPESLVDRLKAAVMRRGVRGFVIDPASYLRGPNASGDGADHTWVGYMLETFKGFAQAHECAGWLVAHPRKPAIGQDVPKGYEISGSAHWFNRPDFGITISRPKDARHMTEVHIWKCRFFWTGQEGKAELFYQRGTGRYDKDPMPVNVGARYSAMGKDVFEC